MINGTDEGNFPPQAPAGGTPRNVRDALRLKLQELLTMLNRLTEEVTAIAESLQASSPAPSDDRPGSSPERDR